ncbi:GntR family transcriptional regulator [Paracoccus homiensis]|uniref:DNA-binding transcriptional regulator, GntR family n=1 Tax=Paracoccus homiensis TaxID=364199 RepID=A0A1I0HXP0_9RHOB|nr:GntR family transcriptional regulator [Paracoccus homiensis]SET87983.1 DNA-binding transcriptional regulator, GntR family [Paracoccus homiensis]
MGQEDKAISNTDRAIAELRRLVFSGELAAGSDHLESELAERLGMSRTPVREAARTLESQGLLELRARKGVRILSVSPTDMREIYDVLTELESLAAERAAERCHDADHLAALAQAIADMDRSLEARDLEAWAQADDRFHAELVRLGGNSRVIAIVAMLGDQVRRARAVTLFMRPLPVQSNRDHQGVYEAILRGDATAARDLHRAHRQQARDMILELLERHRLRQL